MYTLGQACSKMSRLRAGFSYLCKVELLFEILTPERLLFNHIKYKASCSIDNTESNTGVGFESGTKIGISAAVCAESYIYRSTTRLLHVHPGW